MTKREICERLIKLHENVFCVIADDAREGRPDSLGELAAIAKDLGDLLLDLAAPEEKEPKEEKPEADQDAAGAWFKCCPLRNKGLNPACVECEPTLCKYCAQSPLLLFEDGAPTRPCPYCNDGEMVKLKTPLKMKKGYSVWFCKTCHEPFVEAEPKREEVEK